MYVDPFHQRLVAGTSSVLSWQQIGGDGEPADPGTVTVTVTRADGTALATDAATTGSTTAARNYTLSAALTATLDRLSVVWKASGVTLATTEVDVVGAPCFSNAELRTAETSLANESKFTPAILSLARLQVETFFEQITGRRFTPGYHYATIPGAPGYNLVLPHVELRSVRSAILLDDPSSTATETLAAGELAAIPANASGIATRYTNTWDARWVRLGYVHGYVTCAPDVKRQMMRLTRELVLNEKSGQIPDNATTWQSTEMGWSAVLVTPGVRGAHTRLPSVNKCLDDWTFERVGIA